jgi:subtilisin family serine protease
VINSARRRPTNVKDSGWCVEWSAGSPLAHTADSPAEFGAPGRDIPVAPPSGGTATVTGNSFAAPYAAGLVALLRSKHPSPPCVTR